MARSSSRRTGILKLELVSTDTEPSMRAREDGNGGEPTASHPVSRDDAETETGASGGAAGSPYKVGLMSGRSADITAQVELRCGSESEAAVRAMEQWCRDWGGPPPQNNAAVLVYRCDEDGTAEPRAALAVLWRPEDFNAEWIRRKAKEWGVCPAEVA